MQTESAQPNMRYTTTSVTLFKCRLKIQVTYLILLFNFLQAMVMRNTTDLDTYKINTQYHNKKCESRHKQDYLLSFNDEIIPAASAGETLAGD